MKCKILIPRVKLIIQLPNLGPGIRGGMRPGQVHAGPGNHRDESAGELNVSYPRKGGLKSLKSKISLSTALNYG